MSHFFFKFTNVGRFFSNFCGLLRVYELHIPVVPRLVAKINWASLLNPTNIGLKAVVGPE